MLFSENEAFLVASDSDYQPVVRELRKHGVRVVYVGFEVNPNLGLIAKTDDRIIIPNKEVLAHVAHDSTRASAA
ncbi:MAG: NYN domain-containing protein [Minisyncoccota bacterium]